MPGSEQTGPHVRYAQSEDNQYPYLHHWNEPIPDDARFVSPIYALTDEQAETNQWYRKNGAYKAPNAKQIAKQSMDDCENHAKPGRVLYPIQLDIDGYRHGVTPEDAIGTARLFIQELGFSPNEEHWYLSGGEARNPEYKGTHCHLPAVCTYEELCIIKQQAQSYNEKLEQLNTSLQLDAQVYSKKRLFRLPGAEHQDSGKCKVSIDRNGNPTGVTNYHTYEDIARVTGIVTANSEWKQYILKEKEREGLLDAGDGTGVPLSQESEKSEQNTYLNGRQRVTHPRGKHCSESQGNWVVDWSKYPHYTSDGVQQCYQAHHRRPFSPYKWGSHDYSDVGASVSVFSPHQGAFAPLRGTHSWDNYPDEHDFRDGQALVPAHILHAVGRNGEYRIEDDYAPVFVGKRCYENNREKINESDWLVFIQGQSNLAKLLSVSVGEAGNVAIRLDGPDGRQKAIAYLRERDYEIKTGEDHSSGRHYRNALPKPEYGESDMAQVQREIESGKRDLRDLSRDERLNLGNRLLRIYDCNREPIHEWYQEQYGPKYSRAITDAQLDYIEQSYDDLGTEATEIEL